MAKAVCGVYRITNTLNGKVYVGQSKNVRERFYEHKRKLRLQTHFNRYLQNAYNKHGEYFEYEIIEECGMEQLDLREMYWIGFYRADHKDYGYNIMSGGQANRLCAERTKALISKPVMCIETEEVYSSVAEAQRATQIGNISMACNGKIRHAGGFHWCFCEDAEPDRIESIMVRQRKLPRKKVVCIETGEVFDSLTQAAEAHGLSVATICRSCNKRNALYKKKSSLHWKYYEEVAV